jgi:signal transduction histidine kinase
MILGNGTQVVMDVISIAVTGIIFLFHKLGKTLFAQIYFVYILSMAVTLLILCFGKEMTGDYFYLLFAISAVVFFDNKALLFGGFAFLFFQLAGQKLYLNYFPPLMDISVNFLENFISFIGFSNAVIFILSVYKKQNIETEKSLRDSLFENEKKNAALEKANGELERFAHIASHDLKSPLRNVVSFLNLIERKIAKKDYDSVGEYLQFAKKGGEQMNQLVDDILQFSTIKSDVEIPTETVDLNEVFEVVKHQFYAFLEDKNATISSSKLPTIVVNKLLISILFQNLIENGLKYNNNIQPKVIVEYVESANTFTLNFIDNGIGIASDYHEKIFNLFTRLHANDAYQGTGLGLSICKKIVEQMGATISVYSELNEGATFSVLFNKN